MLKSQRASRAQWFLIVLLLSQQMLLTFRMYWPHFLPTPTLPISSGLSFASSCCYQYQLLSQLLVHTSSPRWYLLIGNPNMLKQKKLLDLTQNPKCHNTFKLHPTLQLYLAATSVTVLSPFHPKQLVHILLQELLPPLEHSLFGPWLQLSSLFLHNTLEPCIPQPFLTRYLRVSQHERPNMTQLFPNQFSSLKKGTRPFCQNPKIVLSSFKWRSIYDN